MNTYQITWTFTANDDEDAQKIRDTMQKTGDLITQITGNTPPVTITLTKIP